MFEVRKFILISRVKLTSWKFLCYLIMAFVLTEHQKRYLIEIYFRIGSKINGEWVYFVKDAYQDCLQAFAHILVAYDHFRTAIRRFVQLFRETRCVDSKNERSRRTQLEPEKLMKPLGN